MSPPGRRLRLSHASFPNANDKTTKRELDDFGIALHGREATDKTPAVDRASFLTVWQPPDLLLRLCPKRAGTPARFPKLHDPREAEGSAGTLRVGDHEIHVPYLPKFI